MRTAIDNQSTEPEARQLDLQVFCIRRGLKGKDLAAKLGVSPSLISKIFKGDRRSPEVIKGLVELGIPAHLLPEPKASDGVAA